MASRAPRSARAAALAGAVIRRQRDRQVGLVASGAAFWLVISAFPAAAAVVSLYGLLVDPDAVADDLGRLLNAAPASLGSVVGEQLRRIAATDRPGLTTGLVVSVLLAVWSASAGVYNLDQAIRDVHGQPRQRFLEAKTRALAEAFVVVVALGAIALASTAIAAHSHGVVAAFIGVPAAFGGIVAAVTGLYRFAIGPSARVRSLLPGAAAASAAMVVLVFGFAAYASASSHYTAIYGAFSAAVIAMVATYLSVYAVLLGAALNVEVARRSW